LTSRDVSSTTRDKELIRQRVWAFLEERNIARFPRPVFNRIPNFVGAEEAGKKVAATMEFEEAGTIKVNPDSAQRQVRLEALSRGKLLLMPTPRLRGGFILLDRMVPKDRLRAASTIRGAFMLGKQVPLDKLPVVDLAVVGSVAVAPDGGRIGKGEGYSEMEYAVLRELGLVSESTPIITTVHDSQIVESVPLEEHDIAVDHIVTPTRLLATNRSRPRPTAILWSKVTLEMMKRMPILKELSERRGIS
jgi:5-formyltetrahydrofolate cyclo-ligase